MSAPSLLMPAQIAPLIPRRLYPWLPMMREDLMRKIGPKSHWRHLVDDRYLVLIDYALDEAAGYPRGTSGWTLDSLGQPELPYLVHTSNGRGAKERLLLAADRRGYPKTVSLYIGVPCDIPHVGQIHVSSDDHGWAWQFRAQRNPARVRWIDLPVEGSAAA